MIFTRAQIDYYRSKALFLSKTFEQQYNELYTLGNYLTDDIANDWIESDIPLLEEMIQYKIIGCKAVEIYQQILENFVNVSLNGSFYDSKIWSLEGLMAHDFWEGQRILAKNFLRELEQIKKDI